MSIDVPSDAPTKVAALESIVNALVFPMRAGRPNADDLPLRVRAGLDSEHNTVDVGSKFNRANVRLVQHARLTVGVMGSNLTLKESKGTAAAAYEAAVIADRGNSADLNPRNRINTDERRV